MISIVVAIGENNVIGKDNQLIWYLPADLKHFKQYTIGKHMIMGRKTFESIGKALPGRITIIVSRQKDYTAEGCIVVDSLENAYKEVPEGKEACVVGGAEIFRQCLPDTDIIYLTRIHQTFEGDTFFPEIDMKTWEIKDEENHKADEKNPYDYSYYTLVRKN